MKKVAVFSSFSFVILFALAVLGSSLLNTKIDKITKDHSYSESVLGDEDIKSKLEVNFKSKNYYVSLFKANPSKLTLIANFGDKKNASKIVQQNECKSAINAGFYSLEDNPLGLFISDSKELHPFIKNSTMNGILSINYFDTPRITRDTPRDSLISAVQTGPLLIENDSLLDVSITTDKNARRSVAFVDGNNNLYFASIYDKTSGFIGPRLEDLPEIISIIEDKLEINIADAINLDGGSASYFSSENTTLTELSPIGALFCQK